MFCRVWKNEGGIFQWLEQIFPTIGNLLLRAEFRGLMRFIFETIQTVFGERTWESFLGQTVFAIWRTAFFPAVC